VPSEYSDVSRKSDSDLDITKKLDTNEVVTIKVLSPTTQEQQQLLEQQQQQQQLLEQQQQQHVEVLSKQVRMDRVHRVAMELLTTEEQYVTVLYLIDQVNFLIRSRSPKTQCADLGMFDHCGRNLQIFGYCCS
jgi:hypothetical protein